MSRQEKRFNRVARMIGATENYLETEELDSIYLKQYFSRLITNQFGWDSDEDTLDTTSIERIIFYNGMGAFWLENEILMFGSCQCISVDYYQRPSVIQVYKPNGEVKTLKSDEFVVVYDNNLRDFVPYHFMNKYANRIANVDLAIETNLENLKTPVIIECEESQLNSFSDLFRKIRSNRKTIPVAKGTFQNSSANVLDLNCPNNIAHFLDYRESLFNELLTSFGINCVDIRKKERLTQAEGNSNNERVELFRNSRLQSRERAVKEIAIKFNRKVEVKLNVGINSNTKTTDRNQESDMVQ